MESDEPLPTTTPDQPPLPSPADVKVLHSEELFAGGRVVIIEHAGAMYRLQITARGRLILQK
ncbi:MAG TPA: hemin uptake protein HemP [Pirellulales bacterium]|jgi:hemin uptake protein HemP|nr:hemin uptake protein HemP [Pirellulales bacterium]